MGGQTQSTVFGEVLKGRTPRSVIEDELLFFFRFGRGGAVITEGGELS